MSDVYPYALLTADPTTEMRISWIDNTGDGGGEQTVAYGTEPDDFEATESADGEYFPESDDAYLYHATLTGLEPGTTYHVEIRSSETIAHEFSTLPVERPEHLRIGVTSDHHPWRPGIGMADVGDGPDVMDEFGKLEPDIVFYPGDFVTMAQSTTSGDTSNWLQWFDEYMGNINQDYLKPFFAGAGNHELALIVEQGWDGRKAGYDEDDLTPDTGYFQFLFPNIVELDPVGENYGSITVSDYLQLVMLDSHSAFVDEQSAWLAETLDHSVDMVIPGCHQPMLPGGDRGSYDLMASMRSFWAPQLHEAPNVRFYFNGNEHTYKHTYPWKIVEEEPEEGEYFDLDDSFYEREGIGYMVVEEKDSSAETIAREDGIVEFGDGWPNARSTPSREGDWFLNYVEGENVDEAQFHTIDVRPSSTAVTEWNQTGERMAAHDFDISLIDVDGPTVRAGETLVVEAEIANEGDGPGTQDVRMVREGANVAVEPDVEIHPSDAESVTLEWETLPVHEGIWTLSVESDDDADTIDVAVVPAENS